MRLDVAVVGLGYVGLSLAREASRARLRVVGFEVSRAVADGIRAGRSHVDDVTDEDLQAMAADGFTVATDPAVLGQADVIVICTPTPLTAAGMPDLGAVRAASSVIARQLRRGMLVILESTSYPGTTDEVVRPILERGSSLTAGQDFHLAYSPERIEPGNLRYGLATTPKVVGGYTPGCATAAASFYRTFVEAVVHAKGCREAELAKILENTYRSVNIALINEMAQLAHDLGIDIWDAIDCAATKPFGFQPFYPGPGPGGHCIPIDPSYFSYLVRSRGSVFQLAELAREINSGMPRYVIERVARMLNREKKSVNGSTVLLLGVTYKPNVADQRGAAALEVARQLLDLGAAVVYHDPFVPHWVVGDSPIPHQRDLPAALRDADLTILLQDHTVYDPAELVRHACLLFDASGRTRGLADDRFEVL